MLTTALILGFAGSLHCIGMCSPLAIAVTTRGEGGMAKRIFYNAGRIFMYSVLGAIVSTVGAMLPASFQYAISIILGVSLLLIALTKSNFSLPGLAFVYRITNFLKTRFSQLLQKRNYAAIFGMGILNGLLPCGLTFLALTSCITLDGPLGGFVFMAAFGLGTLPVMLGMISVIPFFTQRLKFNLSSFVTVMQIAAGCLLIVRVLLIDVSGHITTAGVDSITICP
jgi:sulfite exporter TauE/SafE